MSAPPPLAMEGHMASICCRFLQPGADLLHWTSATADISFCPPQPSVKHRSVTFSLVCGCALAVLGITAADQGETQKGKMTNRDHVLTSHTIVIWNVNHRAQTSPASLPASSLRPSESPSQTAHTLPPALILSCQEGLRIRVMVRPLRSPFLPIAAEKNRILLHCSPLLPWPCFLQVVLSD